jgi:hypothetical protein
VDETGASGSDKVHGRADEIPKDMKFRVSNLDNVHTEYTMHLANDSPINFQSVVTSHSVRVYLQTCRRYGKNIDIIATECNVDLL